MNYSTRLPSPNVRSGSGAISGPDPERRRLCRPLPQTITGHRAIKFSAAPAISALDHQPTAREVRSVNFIQSSQVRGARFYERRGIRWSLVLDGNTRAGDDVHVFGLAQED